MRFFLPIDHRLDSTSAITDEQGRVRYTLSGDPWAPTRRMYLTDRAGRTAAQCRQRLPSLLPAFSLEVYGKPAGMLVKDLTLSPPRFFTTGPDWELQRTDKGGWTMLAAGEPAAELAPADQVRLCLAVFDEQQFLRALAAAAVLHWYFG